MPAAEAIVVCGRDIEGNTPPPTNFNIYRNVIKPYSSDDSFRVPSSGISVHGLKNAQITDNVIFDSGNHADLIITSPKGFVSTVICRDNYHPDGTPLAPRDGSLEDHSRRTVGPAAVRWPEHHVDPCQRQDSD